MVISFLRTGLEQLCLKTEVIDSPLILNVLRLCHAAARFKPTIEEMVCRPACCKRLFLAHLRRLSNIFDVPSEKIVRNPTPLGANKACSKYENVLTLSKPGLSV